MNARWVAFHLEEAKEQIEQTIRELSDPDYSEDSSRIDVQHMLHHIHTAYNSRNVQDTDAITDEEFLAHQKPPTDIEWG